MIAALYIAPKGVYYGLSHVEPWGLPDRDARNYAGPWPVVAHPPCSRWCRLAGLVEARWGYKRGEDDGCFEAALRAVRMFGGVLEHPAYSDAWKAFALPVPGGHGWQGGICGGWSAAVAQGKYGHRAKKATWLYAYGVTWLPELDWGIEPDHIRQRTAWRDSRVPREGRYAVYQCGAANGERSRRPSAGALVTQAFDDRPCLSKRESNATPIAFRDVLIEIAESANRERVA